MGGRERVCTCVCEFCVICWYQYFRQKYVLEEEGAKPNPDPPSCSHYNLRRHMKYILTLTSLSLSLTKYTHFLGFTISYVAMVIQTLKGRVVWVCVCVCVRERERMGGRERVCTCVCEFCVICWYQYFRQKYVLEEEGAKPNPDPPSCSHYNLRRHMKYILTLTSLSLSLTKYTHFLGFTISCVAMVF